MTAAWMPRRDFVGRAVRECLAAELPGLAVTAGDENQGAAAAETPDRGSAALAGIGTIAAHALASPMLVRALAAEGLGIATPAGVRRPGQPACRGRLGTRARAEPVEA